MGRCFGEHGDDEREDAEGVQDDGGVVEVAKDVHAECVYKTVRNQDGSVDADSLAGRWDVVEILDGGSGRYQARETERDTCCDCYLTKEIEPGVSIRYS